MGEVSIEPARVEDVEALGRMFHADMTDLGVSTTLEAQTQLARNVVRASTFPHTDSETPECICLVAKVDGGDEAVGVILGNVTWSLEVARRALWIEELYVDPSARRRGLGRALVDALLDWAEEHDIGGVDIEAYRGNTPASVLYRTMGFRRLGRERFSYTL